jgi:hypothetical protein
MDRFTLTIDLGGDAMQTGSDVARALHKLAVRLDNTVSDAGSIMDDNGNTAGAWSFENDDA